MSTPPSNFPGPRASRDIRPAPYKLSQRELVAKTFLTPQEQFIQVVEACSTELNLAQWIRDNRQTVESDLLNYGGLLFRAFPIQSVSEFEETAKALSNGLADYRERAAPRKQVQGKIYTSTEFSSEHAIPLHHEMSYSHNWPAKILFFCQQPADSGGATPLANDVQVFRRIDVKIKERFLEQGVMYMRNFGPGFDTWQDVFQTNQRVEVEAYCNKWRIHFEWLDGDRLRTRQVRQAVATHPQTGQTVWFNHAHMFHVSNLAPSLRDSLLAMGPESDLPRNAYYGDGSQIADSVLDEIRNIYREQAVTFSWQRGDVLVLDNYLTCHGREPYSGSRSILVAMADMHIEAEFKPHAGC